MKSLYTSADIALIQTNPFFWSTGKFEMRWHREFNSDKQGCHVTCPVEIKKMKIQCGSTAYPKAIDANPGSKITWKPQNGYSVTWAESICLPNGTWSKGPPCCELYRCTCTHTQVCYVHN